ncbi:hypothetical protein K438DRAFT_1845793 [Mycena galopus ATCC 62051]|nr:hypothetical protein K438DRAFT_1845793 [Mycena galopus ATCC 62051]
MLTDADAFGTQSPCTDCMRPAAHACLRTRAEESVYPTWRSQGASQTRRSRWTNSACHVHSAFLPAYNVPVYPCPRPSDALESTGRKMKTPARTTCPWTSSSGQRRENPAARISRSPGNRGQVAPIRHSPRTPAYTAPHPDAISARAPALHTRSSSVHVPWYRAQHRRRDPSKRPRRALRVATATVHRIKRKRHT